ncbi:MAG: prephenate dehydrogenase [Anaerolineae bacterium]|nr:prephenate dehydrogenase [Anaerolineae bacterium]MDW8099844.1 prephenate dehydrogenase [Anaerolineae bacterium]
MAKAKITIVGLGVVGSSIGMALCQGDREFEVIGHDREPGVAAAARKAGAVDRTEWNLIRACEDADFIILALPVMAIRETMEAITHVLKPGCIITDTASIKEPVLRWADELLPDSTHFVGGDPILRHPEGRAATGVGSAELLQGAIYCLCPAPTTAPDAVQVVASLVSRLGAQPLFLDASEHDGLMAGADQLPAVLAVALLEVTALTAPWQEMRKLAGAQYQSATWLSSGDPAIYCDAMLANRENVVRWIDTYIAGLQRWRQRIVEGEPDVLKKSLEQMLAAREQWQQQKASGRWEASERESLAEIPSPWQSLFGIRRWPRKP